MLAPNPQDTAASVRRIAWPVIGEHLLQTLVGVVDMAVVGRLGSAEVAGIGAATQLVALVISAVAALSVGATVLVARSTGARDPRAAGHVTQQALLAGLLLGTVLAVVGGVFADEMIRVLGADEAVVREGGRYLRINALAWVPLVLMLVVGGALRGAGDARAPLRASVWMNVVNVTLAIPLAFGYLGLPALGVAGVALAAAVARAIGACLVLAIVLRNRQLTFERAGWRWNGAVQLRVLRIGVPTSVEQVLLSGGFLFYGAMVITLGTTVYAAQRISFQAINLAFMPAMGFGTAATTLTGQHLGAGRPDLAALATRSALRQCLLLMVGTGVLCAAGAPLLMRLFSTDPEVIRLGTQALPVLALAQPFWAISSIYAGSLRGAGDSRFPMISTNLGMWVLRLPSAYLFGIVLGYGLPGVYLSSTIDAGARSLLTYLRYRTGNWRTREV
ncbi:MAG: Multi antimicrobial extrusion protein (Na(+)/drug antiporter), MATE family of MDR efflux pumps [uncultured Chloroflexi bacterium]|uniref:Probable multidrug resistance protein NorM n=1 Tax=uncultured Chloroflexota bacterium TaxID=166587 RepID=A0A6J4K877_9CHLR|nr:MAG: Multi antimicrobial extrusion protein (Na(+)/drug antiporter), MATE family of MDR efflux pumps [uncultured Chloroflexota bacterium]